MAAWWVSRGTAKHAAADVEPWTHEPGRHPWTLAERLLVPVMIGVVALWIGPGLLQATLLGGSTALETLQRRLPEAVVPMLGALLLFVLPAGSSRGEQPEAGGGSWLRGPRILDVSIIRKVDWGTLLLFGGGLSLGQLMFSTGLARWLGESVSEAAQAGPPSAATTFFVVLAATTLSVVVSEITSNTASAALVVPVVLALAQAAGVDPLKPALAATVGCSVGFMLPVSTPPNALVYGTGRLRIREMITRGSVLDIAGVLVVSVWVTLFA
jgi:sodium-dependent dicarboxylate transporter 2/3/5